MDITREVTGQSSSSHDRDVNSGMGDVFVNESYSGQCKIRCAGKTDAGALRKKNEDDFLIDKNLNLFAIADGVGGSC